jgi:hypothetical protein
MKKALGIILLGALAPFLGVSQEQPVQTFKDTRIVNGHSVETSFQGEMKFIISHRFGMINGGAYELFGLDQSTIRLGLDYGLTDKLTVGIGRSSFEKTVDGFVKYRALTQQISGGSPVSVTGLATIAVKGIRFEDPEIENFFTSRLYYAYQILIARQFHDRFSLQAMPSLVHRNLVPTVDDAHDVYALGSAFRFQLTKQVAIQAEYYWLPPGQVSGDYHSPVSVGFDVETKGHVFQFHLSNSTGMIEKFYITETRGLWQEGDIHFGFNITRDFRIRGRK